MTLEINTGRRDPRRGHRRDRPRHPARRQVRADRRRRGGRQPARGLCDDVDEDDRAERARDGRPRSITCDRPASGCRSTSSSSPASPPRASRSSTPTRVNDFVDDLADVTEGRREDLTALITAIDDVSRRHHHPRRRARPAPRSAPRPSPPRWPRRTTPSSPSSTRAGPSSPCSTNRRGELAAALGEGAEAVTALAELIADNRPPLDHLLTNLHPTARRRRRRARRRQPGPGLGRPRLLRPGPRRHPRPVARHLRARASARLSASSSATSSPRRGQCQVLRRDPRVRLGAGLLAGLLAVGLLAAAAAWSAVAATRYDVTAYFPRAVPLYEQGAGAGARPPGRRADVVTERCLTRRRRRTAVRPGRAHHRRRRRPARRRARHARSRSRSSASATCSSRRPTPTSRGGDQPSPTCPTDERVIPLDAAPSSRSSPTRPWPPSTSSSESLDPDGLGRLIDNAAEAPRRQRRQPQPTPSASIADLVDSFAERDDELAADRRQLRRVHRRRSSPARRQIGEIIESFARTARVLAEERQNLEALLAGLAQRQPATASTWSPSTPPRSAPTSTPSARLGQSLVANLDAVTQLLDAGPAARRRPRRRLQPRRCGR